VKHLETIIISTTILAVTKQCGSDAATIELILKLFFSAWLWVSIKNEKVEAFCHFVTNAQTNLSGTPDGCQDN